jgi:TatD DNase family protein
MQIIDTHAHIYADAFREDADAMIQRARAAGLVKVLMPNIDAASLPAMLQLAAQHPGFCIPMLGLHPCSVNAQYQSFLSEMENMLRAHSFVAIGETGLDYYWDKTFAAQQQTALRFHAQLASKHQLPLVLHTRNSLDDTLAIVQEEKTPALRGVFHCFSGTVKQAEQAISCGFMIGIGGVVTYKNSGLQQVIESLPLDALLLETDAPYLPPVPFRGKRNEPSMIVHVAERIAQIRALDVQQVCAITSANAMRMFRVG